MTEDTTRIERLERAIAELSAFLRTGLALGEQHAPSATEIRDEVNGVEQKVKP